jgi:hypothetical protein
MNTKLIVEAARDTLSGTMPFPEVVAKLIAAGVEYYHVDYAGMRKTFYGSGGEAVVTPITYENMPPIAPEFARRACRQQFLTASGTVRNTATSVAARWRRGCRVISRFFEGSGSRTGVGPAISIPSGFLGLGPPGHNSNVERLSRGCT